MVHNSFEQFEEYKKRKKAQLIDKITGIGGIPLRVIIIVLLVLLVGSVVAYVCFEPGINVYPILVFILVLSAAISISVNRYMEVNGIVSECIKSVSEYEKHSRMIRGTDDTFPEESKQRILEEIDCLIDDVEPVFLRNELRILVDDLIDKIH